MSEVVSYDRIKWSIGLLIFLWSSVERSLDEALVRLKEKRVHRIGQRLDVWADAIRKRCEGNSEALEVCQQLSGALRGALEVRNHVCHGLIEVRAGGRAGERPAALTVKVGDEEEHEHTFNELQAMFSWLERCPDEIRTLTIAAMESDMSRARIPRLDGFPKLAPTASR